jgi:hypothetical protein
MSGGERSPIHNGPLMDRSNMEKSKPASTHKDEINAEPPPLPIFNPEDLIGRPFWINRKMANYFWGQIVELIEDPESKV